MRDSLLRIPSSVCSRALLALVLGLGAGTSLAAVYEVDSTSSSASLNACTGAPGDCSFPGAVSRLAPSGDTIIFSVSSGGTADVEIERSVVILANNARLPRVSVASSLPVIITVTIRQARWEDISGTSPALSIQARHSVTLEEVYFRRNVIVPGPQTGAAIDSSGNLVVRSGIFENNRTNHAGGAIRTRSVQSAGTSTVLIEDSLFDGNFAAQGAGGIHNESGSVNLTVRRTRFLRNGLFDPANPATSARGFFGALKTDGPTTVDGCYFADNDSRYAAAIQSGGNIGITNTTIWRNSTREMWEGGAVLLGGTARISNASIVGNSGQPAGGIYVYPASDVWLVNSLIADNTGANPDISGRVLSIGNNLIRDRTGATIDGNVASNVYDVDARWLAPADNGGPTPTAALADDSPAIDAGSDCVLSAACGGIPAGNLTTDQRGTGFPRKRGGSVDIGAFESSLGIVRNADASGAGSLAQVLGDAQPGDRLVFARPFFDSPRTIGLAATLVVAKPLTLAGPGANLLTLDAGRARRHLNVDAGGNLAVSGLRFTRGDPGGTISAGALLVNAGGTLDGRDLVFEDNAAQIGGCVYNAGTLSFSGVRLSNCRARAAAGALFNAAGATATIGDIRIEGSSAFDNGGAIGNAGNLLAFRVAMIGNQARFGGAFSEYGTTTLRNSTISGNTATGAGGGGIHVDAGGRLTLTHGTVTLNTATTQGGGGVWNNGGVLETQNSVIDGNTGTGGIVDARGVLRSLGHNLIGNTTGSSFAPDSPSLVGNQLNVPARLSPLADNGGFGPTHAPRWDSPLFDAGSAALGFDGRGLIRPVDFSSIANAAGGNGSDLGAYELQVSTPTAVTALAEDGSALVSFTAAANGGPSPDTYTVTCGQQSATGTASPIRVAGLANGVTVTCTVIARSGTLSGIPSAPSAAVTPLATLNFVSGTPPAGQVRTAYAHTFVATGAPAPTYTLDSGELPPGLSLAAATGVLAGTPTATGTYSGHIRATANGATPAVQTYTITIAPNVPAAPTIGSATAGDARVTVSFTPSPDDGGRPVTLFNVVCTSLVGGGTASPITVQGVPNGVAQTCYVVAFNEVGASAPSATANPVVPQALTTLTLSSSANPALPGQPVTYTATLAPTSAGGSVAFDTGSGGTPCPAATITGGVATCTTSYAETGLRTVAASYAGDAASSPASTTLPGGQQVVAATIVIDGQMIEGVVGSAFGPVMLSASGGVAPYLYAIDAGSLPPGVALSAAGSLDGTPTDAGSYDFTVRATDAGNSSATRAFTITVIDVPGTPRNVAATPGDAQASIGFEAPLGDGGAPITGYRAQCGTQQVDGADAPLVVTGLVNGTQVACTVRAINRAGPGPASASVTVVPQASTVLVLASSLNPALPGQPVTFTATATPSSATGTVTFDTGNGSTVCAPAAMVAGVATCTTSYIGAGTRTVSASYAGDAAHRPAQAILAGGQRIDAATITIGGAPPTGTFGSTYGPATFTATGGVAPYMYTIASGALPPGLNLGSDGTLAGTPTAAGTYGFSVRATDAGQSSATVAHTVSIARANQAPLAASASPSTIRVGGTSTLATTGGSGTGAITYAVTAGAAACAIAGSTLSGLAAGSCTVTATRAADANHNAATATVVVTVQPAGTDLEISITNGRSGVLPASLVEYEILVANAGPIAVQGARVRDPVPTGLTDVLWTCAPVQGASCPQPAGTGGIDQLVDLPVNGVLRYVFSARVDAAAGATITNTASVETPSNIVDLEPADNTATDADPVVPDPVYGNGFEGPPQAISVPLRAP